MTNIANSSNSIDDVSIINRGKYICVLIHDTSKVKELENGFINIVQSPRDIIFNCIYVEEFTSIFITTIKALEQQIVPQGKKFIFINVSEELQKEIESDELTSHFVIKPCLLSAIELTLLEEEKIETEISFIKAFVNAAVKTIFVQAKTLSKRKGLSMISKDKNQLKGVISGVLNINDPSQPYVIIISFPEHTFLELISRMTGEQFTEITDEIEDGARELMNIIYGQANSVMQNSKTDLCKPPALIIGNEFPGVDSAPEVTQITDSLETGVTLEIEFESSVGNFSLRIWFPNESIAKALISS